MISNEEIMKAVFPNNQEMEVKELDFNSIPSITHNKAIEHYDRMILYAITFPSQCLLQRSFIIFCNFM